MEKSNETFAPSSVGDEEVFFVTTASKLIAPGVEEHSGYGPRLTKRVEAVKEDLAHVLAQLRYIIAEAEKSASTDQFPLEEISVSLGFTASGKIAFIAEASIEGSIQVTFKRK